MGYLITSLTLLSCVAVSSAQQPTNMGLTPADLVKQLGSRKFAERDAAAAALDVLGAAALPALELGLKSTDPEIRQRAEKVRLKIQGRLESAQLLAGKRVRLVYKDTPLAEAIDDLAVRTGFPIQYGGDRDDLDGRTVTPDTGP